MPSRRQRACVPPSAEMRHAWPGVGKRVTYTSGTSEPAVELKATQRPSGENAAQFSEASVRWNGFGVGSPVSDSDQMSLPVLGLLVTTRIDEPSGDQLDGPGARGRVEQQLARRARRSAAELKRPDCSGLNALSTRGRRRARRSASSRRPHRS